MEAVGPGAGADRTGCAPRASTFATPIWAAAWEFAYKPEEAAPAIGEFVAALRGARRGQRICT